MSYQIRHLHGGVIAAKVELAAGSVTLHSRGGATSGRPERNPEYSAAFDAIIDRLAPQAGLITRVLLDSRRVRGSEVEVVLAVADDFARLPLDEVKRQIRRTARAFGRKADAAPNQGNSTKQLRFEVSLGLADLMDRLSVSDIGTEAERESPGASTGTGDDDGHAADHDTSPPLSDEDRSWSEGDKRKVAHLRRERARGLATLKKADMILRDGKLVCERCGLVPSERLGPYGDAVIEVHHKWPLADAENAHRTRLEDLACLCANCHRITHREMVATPSSKLPLQFEQPPPGGPER